MFSPSTDVHSHSSNIPNTNTDYGPLSLGTPPQFLHGNAAQPLRALEYPLVEQPQNIHPLPAANLSLHDWQQSAPLPQGSLAPHPQSQARVESSLAGVSLCGNTLSGPPPEAATTSSRRELVDESAPQITDLPPR
jgi:hypothetical protein